MAFLLPNINTFLKLYKFKEQLSPIMAHSVYTGCAKIGDSFH